MTAPEDRQELRRWSAEDLLGWKLRTVRFEPIDEEIQVWFKDDEFMSYFDDWRPDSDDAPAWQLRSVIEKMRELGFSYKFGDNVPPPVNYCEFWKYSGELIFEGRAFDDNLWIAVLLAARAAWESER